MKGFRIDRANLTRNNTQKAICGLFSALTGLPIVFIVSTAIKLVCNFRTIAGGLLVVTSGMALRSCSSLDEFVEAFSKVVLVSYSKLAEISEGSLCFTVQAETSSALKELWDIYKDGTLQNRLQEFLVTDEIKQLASGEDVAVTVYIDEQEYKAAYLDLMLLQKEGKVLKHINFVSSLSATWKYSDKNKLSLVCGKINDIPTGNF